MPRFILLFIILLSLLIFCTGCSKSTNADRPVSLLYDTSIYVPQMYGIKPVLYQLPLSPQAALSHFEVLDGYKVELFAAEPDVINPIAINWDHRGRLWVIESLDYPHGSEDYFSRIKILEDTDLDGKADQVQIFADSLRLATSLTFSDEGVIVAQAPDLLFLKDTNGDDKADQKKILHSGWGTYDTHAGPANLKYGFDNKIWGTVGYAGFNGVDEQDSTRFSQGVFRFNRDGSDVEQYAQFSNNTWGLGFSEAMDVFGSTANNMHAIHIGIPLPFYNKAKEVRYHGSRNIATHFKVTSLLKNLRQVDNQGGFTAATGFSIYTARSFPEEYWNKVAFVCEPTAGIVHQAILKSDGASFTEIDGGNIIASSDEWFSPVQAEIGPDGMLWIADWYNFIIQHNPTPIGFRQGKGNAYFNPLRDKNHGRIYRVIYKNAKQSTLPSIDIGTPESLVKTLEHPNQFWRFQAQRLLIERNHQNIIPHLIKIINQSTESNWIPAVHALWTLHGLGAFNKKIADNNFVIHSLFAHPHPVIRKTAINVAPKNDSNLKAVLQSGTLQDVDLNVRLHSILNSCLLPGRPDLIEKLLALCRIEENYSDPLIAEALLLALSHHKTKVLNSINRDKLNLPEQNTRKGIKAGWHLPEYNVSSWSTIKTGQIFESQIPELKSFNGTIWYRTQVNLPFENFEQSSTISLGAIDNSDVTWINGIKVGSTSDRWEEKRFYQIPAGVLKKGLNTIAVKVDDLRDVGGMTGDKSEIYFKIGESKIFIPNQWQYAIESHLDKKPIFSGPEDLLNHFITINQSYNPILKKDTSKQDMIIIKLQPLNRQIRFKQDTFYVAKNKPIQIEFTNTDNMFHNLVIGKPASLEIIGKASERLKNDFTYIPKIDKVLFSLLPLKPGEKKILSFTAPEKAGDYIFVCTLPGHWKTMNGILRVQ